MTRQLVEGSEAVARAMIQSGCTFFAGYPMTPFTEVLEHMAELLPAVGGVCINAESELEAVGMTWGAAAAGARAATGSTGQGLSLMQESIAEATMAGVGFIVLNMARGQGDYFQATRGGGHGDYRTPVLAPGSADEIDRFIGLGFDWADQWRNPVVIVGDYHLAHTASDREVTDGLVTSRPTPDWCLDGSTGGTGGAKLVSPLGTTKQRDGVGYDLSPHYAACAQRRQQMEDGIEPEFESVDTDDAELLVVAYGTMARIASGAVRELRAEGARVGLFRPITLWPFPAHGLRRATTAAEQVVVYENNAGQMIDDVQLTLLGSVAVTGVNGFGTDASAFGIAPDATVANLIDELRPMLGAGR